MKAKRKRSNEAVSEVIGTVSLLGIAVALFAVLHIIVFSYPVSPSTPSVNLIGTIDENGMIVLQHLGGDSLSLDTKILLTRGSITVNKIVEELLIDDDNDEWNIGEKLVIEIPVGTPSETVEITVVDVESNSIVMMGKIQEGTN